MNNVKNERVYVSRPIGLDREQLTEHIKAVGQAIINEAEDLGDPHKMYLEINATIGPGEEITTVKFTYEVYADPRTQHALRKEGTDDA